MSSEQELYRRWVNGLWGGEPIAADLVSDDFVGHWPDREVRGPEQLQAIVDQTRNSMKDLAFVIEVEPFVDGDLLAGRWIGTGATVSGPMRFTGNDIMRIADGKFVEYWTGTSTA